MKRVNWRQIRAMGQVCPVGSLPDNCVEIQLSRRLYLDP